MKIISIKNTVVICFMFMAGSYVLANAESDYSQISLEELRELTDSQEADISSLGWLESVLGNNLANLKGSTEAAKKKMQEKADNDLVISTSPTTELSKKLWKSRIEVSKEPENNKIKDDLDNLIEKIDSVKFAPPEKKNSFIEKLEAAEIEKEEQAKQIAAKKAESKIVKNDILSKETLELLQAATQEPEKIQNPFEMGEVLFSSGQLKEAADCYTQALKNMDSSSNDADRCWALLQIGNCLTDIDPQKALDSYRRLTAEYPDTVWADMAQAKTKIINFKLIEKPEELLVKNIK